MPIFWGAGPKTTSPLRAHLPQIQLKDASVTPSTLIFESTSVQHIYLNLVMSYYDIDAILTDAEVRTAQPWLSNLVVNLGHIHIAAADPDLPPRKSPASSTSKSLT